MTVGEYAQLLCGQGWVGAKRCQLRVIACRGYRHEMTWEATGRPWLPPSPNLPTPQSARWYPYLCLFEGTQVSVGRGTDRPFEQVGLPKSIVDRAGKGLRAMQRDALLLEVVSFRPVSLPGKAAKPLHENATCSGHRLVGDERDPASLWYTSLLLLETYANTWGRVSKQGFFNAYFPKLSGQRDLADRILGGESIEGIYNRWQPQVKEFKALRARYLLYP